ncbi:MAG: bacillithiol system redox-active protein YtxJ [Bacteroidota bacterium]
MSLTWNSLTAVDQLEALIDNTESEKGSSFGIYKHSTRCSISSMAKFRLERSWDIQEDQLPIYYLDILRHRDVSNYIAERFGIRHESPQFLLIKQGNCVYDASHTGISLRAIRDRLVA